MRERMKSYPGDPCENEILYDLIWRVMDLCLLFSL